MSRACVCKDSNKFYARYKCFEYALGEFGARLRHASACYTRVPILRDIASVTMRRAFNV